MCLWFSYITRSVSLVVVRFLRNALECHYARVWQRWPVIVWRFSTYCVFITVSTVCLCHERKILLISWFLSTFVHLQLSVLAGVCLVKNSDGVSCSSEARSNAQALSLFVVLHSQHVGVYRVLYFKHYHTNRPLVNVVFLALYSACVLCAMSW